MASSSNIGLARLPWGRLPRSPVSSPNGMGSGSSALEVSFRDIMAEQQKESCKEQDFEEYVQTSYVTVGTSSSSSSVVAPASVAAEDEEEEEKNDSPEVEKSFLQLEDLDTDLQLVMSFYEDQDFDDASYELSEQDLDDMADDDSDKYYEGLAKKLSTVVELQSNSLTKSVTGSSIKGNKGNRAASGSLTQNLDSLIDSQSKIILDKLKRKGILRVPSSTYRPIHVGKSVTILHAAGGMLLRRDDPASSSVNILKLRLPKECALKVFKNVQHSDEPAETGEEEQRLIEAKREMTHLNRMTRAGIPCPQVQFLHGHVLVTDFLGKDGHPAKKLKNANEVTCNKGVLKQAYEQIVNNMKTLFKTCHLVHGDLSEDNILWHKRQAYFTSVGAAVNSNRPRALELLYRDCTNITEFFGKKGKPDCDSPQQLFRWITGFDFTGQLQEEACCGGGGYEQDYDFAIV